MILYLKLFIVSIHIRNKVNIKKEKKKSIQTIKLMATIITFTYYSIYHLQLSTLFSYVFPEYLLKKILGGNL